MLISRDVFIMTFDIITLTALVCAGVLLFKYGVKLIIDWTIAWIKSEMEEEVLEIINNK